MKGLAIPLGLVVEEISEIECRKVQEIELYNVTPTEERKRQARKELKGGGKSEKVNGRVANDGKPKQLLTRALSGRWKRHCVLCSTQFWGCLVALEKRFRGKIFHRRLTNSSFRQIFCLWLPAWLGSGDDRRDLFAFHQLAPGDEVFHFTLVGTRLSHLQISQHLPSPGPPMAVKRSVLMLL